MFTCKKYAIVSVTKISCAVFLLSASGAAVSANNMKAESPEKLVSFNQVDKDANGSLSWQELEGTYRSTLESMSLDKDAVLEKYDANRDERLTPPEYAEFSRNLARDAINRQAQQRSFNSPPTHRTENGTRVTVSGDAEAHIKSLAQVPVQNIERLEGAKVVNRANKPVGNIEKVMTENGQIEGVVVSIGGFMDIGDKDVLVRPGQLLVQGDHVVWNTPLSKHRLDNMKEYEKGDSFS